MIDFTGNQWAFVGLVLLLGFAVGLLLASGGGGWKRRYRDLEADNRRLAAERDTAVKEHEARYAAASKRIGELERGAGPIGAGTAAAVAGGARGGGDDLTRISGIDSDREIALNEAGYRRFAEVARLSDADAAALEGRLGLKAGTIAAEDWRGQAAELK